MKETVREYLQEQMDRKEKETATPAHEAEAKTEGEETPKEDSQAAPEVKKSEESQ